MLAAAAVLMTGFGLIYFFWKESGSRKPLVFKALATLMPVLLALFHAVVTKDVFAWCIFAGTVFYMAADVLLEIWFLTGVASFGAGHICVIAGLFHVGAASWYAAVCFVILYGMMFIVTRHYLKDLENLLIPGMVYAALLCFMASMAVSLGIRNLSPAAVSAGIGGVCFVVSDTILGWSHLSGKRRRRYSAVLLALYYMAVYLLAAAPYFG